MQDNQFDNFARMLAQGLSRRQVVKLLIAGAISSVVGSHFSKPVKSSVNKAPPAATEVCSPEILKACIDLAVNDYAVEIQPCAAQCTDLNAPACQTCLNAAASHAIGIIDTCVAGEDISCADELLPQRVFLPLVQSQGVGKTSAVHLSTAGANVNCNESEFRFCQQQATRNATIKLAATCGIPCFATGIVNPVCALCIAGNLALYLSDLYECQRKFGCPASQQCLNGTCCDISRVCGNTCCSASQQCANETCCDNILACVTVCCPAGTQCLQVIGAKRECCPTDQICGTDPICCPSGQKCVNEVCCDTGQICGDSHDICCPANQQCREGICCDNSQVCGDACCSADYPCCGDKYCCPSDWVCVGQDCCIPQLACGTTCCNDFRQICCNGTCLDRLDCPP